MEQILDPITVIMHRTGEPGMEFYLKGILMDSVQAGITSESLSDLTEVKASLDEEEISPRQAKEAFLMVGQAIELESGHRVIFEIEGIERFEC
ncbi:hypothetical protein BH09VER1_BH09VER1_21660 [soil metagenome]